jgi:hypothetical protein
MDNKSNIFLTIEDVLYYIFIIYFFTNASNLYDFYYKNKPNIDAKIIQLCNNGTKYAVNVKNIIEKNTLHYINKAKQYYTPKLETNTDTQIIEKKPEIKYEDKYLQELRNMPNEYVFTEEELKLETDKVSEFLIKAEKEFQQTKTDLMNEIKNNKEKLKQIEEFDYVDCSENCEEKAELKIEENELKEEIELLQIKLEQHNKYINETF